ncbi:SDR family NAD(P)-dependent oxidoreductase [Diaminobutyricibacter sp. McL0608]|uniref:SDR family NAD(P)-dependent oxidoreductase n=1 Tax=Leifsonia sp. McL0608 TaxID=3143537 RepID=UPI0031F2F0EF
MTRPVVVVAGSTSPAGMAVVTALVDAGFCVAAVDLDGEKVSALADSLPLVSGFVCNLADPVAVDALAVSVREELGPVRGLIHLVGGWRGADGIVQQTDADWDSLNTGIVTTLRNTSRSFYDDLEAAAGGRLAIVSARSVTAPTAGIANYVAVKAAAEAWTRAIADGFRASAAQSKDSRLGAAAVVFVVKALVDDGMRKAQPDRTFPGFTDVNTLASATVDLFDTPAHLINGALVPLP